MRVPKYAALEIERRFLVPDCPDLSAAHVRLIEDIYISDTRMRLRAITHSDGGDPEFKLCKKYPSEDPLFGPTANLYLSVEEHAALAILPGRTVRKRRHRMPVADHTFSIDVFEGQLSGLILSEVEANSLEEVRTVRLPSWVSREVTTDPFFTGGNLSQMTAGDLERRLATLHNA